MKSSRAVIFQILILLLSALLAASAVAQTLTLNPKVGPATAQVGVGGVFFGPSELVNVYFDRTDVAAATTGSGGAFRINMIVPLSAVEGRHFITAVGQQSGLHAQTAFTVQPTEGSFFPPGDTLGTATATQVGCATFKGAAGGESGTCYALQIRCPNEIQQQAGIKVTYPPQSTTNLGTITYTVGAGGAAWYEKTFLHGDDGVIGPLLAEGYTAAQIAFLWLPQGLTGNTQLGWSRSGKGMKSAACKWATAAKWVFDNIRQPGTAFCGTGNSAGASAHAYALAYYGFDSLYNAVELTSGPPYGQIDEGCLPPFATLENDCGTSSTSEYDDAAGLIDGAYGNSKACSKQLTGYRAAFQRDSNIGGVANFPLTWIGQLYGGMDTGPTHSHGVLWSQTVTMKDGPISPACIPSAPHSIPDDPAGAAHILADLTVHCK